MKKLPALLSCFVLALVCALLAGSARASTYVVCANSNNIQVLSSTGANGTPIPGGNLGYPVAIAIDQNGNLYVSNDQTPYLIEKFSPTGTDLGAFTTATTLDRPYGLAFDSAGNLYVANLGNNTVEKFSSTGMDLGAFISAGSFNGLSGVVGIAFDGSGNFYAVNSFGNSVAKYTSAGVLTSTFNPSTLSYPYRIAFDTAGNFYVTNYNNNNVEKFSAAGVDQGAFATAKLDGPVGLTFDNNGNLDVCSEDVSNIEEFSAMGADLGALGSVAGSNPSPSDIAFSGGQLEFSASAYSAFEDQGILTITVNRTGDTSGPASVTYATAANGTAVAGTDYATISGGTLSWADGETTKTFQVTILDHGNGSGASVDFDVTLSAPTGATLGTPNPATVTITDNDTPTSQPTITLTAPASDAAFAVGALVTLSATVSNPANLGLVQFFVDGELNATFSPSGSTYTSTAAFSSDGTHQIKVVATGAEGFQSTSSAAVTAYVEPTLVGLEAPPASITVLTGTTVYFESGVEDPDNQISSVQFAVTGAGGGLIPGSNQGDSYNASDPFPISGTYQLQAKLTARDGTTSNSVVRTITVVNPTGGVATAAATFLAGIDGVSVPADGSLNVFLITTSEGGAATPLVTRVDFYENGILFASVDGNGRPIPISSRAPGRGPITRAAPATGSTNLFEATYQVPPDPQQVTITAVATTSDGLSQLTAPLQVTSVVETGTPPVATLGPLAGGQPIPAGASFVVPVAVSAPSVPVAMVQYYLNGALVSASTAPPYRVTVTPPTAGSYGLIAVVTDTNGVSTFAEPLAFTAVPTVSVAVKGDGKAVVDGEKGKVVFTRTGDDLSAPLTVYFKPTGAAKDGVNYTDVGKKVVIPAGMATYKLKIKPIDTMTGPLALKLDIKLLPAPDGSYATGDVVKAKLTLEQTQ